MPHGQPLPSSRVSIEGILRILVMAVVVATPFLFGSTGRAPLSLVITSALLMLILHAARTTRRGFFDVLHLWAGIPAALFCIFIGVQYFFLPALLGDPAPGDAYRQKIAAEVLKLFSYTVIFYTCLLYTSPSPRD